MSYSVLPTVATGDLWTAANHNTYIKDNLAALWPYSAAGDIAVASSASALARLAKGNNYDILSVISGALSYKPLSDLIQFQTSDTIAADTNSSSWIDVPNSTINLTLNATSQLFICLVGTASVASTGGELKVRLAAGSNYSAEALRGTNNPSTDWGQFVQFHHVASYPAGAVTIKAEYKRGVNNIQVYLYNAHVWALAVPKA